MKKKTGKPGKPGKPGWKQIPFQSEMKWMSQYLMSRLAWEFYKKNKNWPVRINLDSIRFVGRNISVEME